MSTATLTASDAEVLEAMEAEIDSIKVDTDSGSKVEYSPSAWTREGRTD